MASTLRGLLPPVIMTTIVSSTRRSLKAGIVQMNKKTILEKISEETQIINCLP
jgi:hypothetical protein